MSSDGVLSPTWRDWLEIAGIMLSALQCLALLRAWLRRRRRIGPDRSGYAFLLPALRALQEPIGVAGCATGVVAFLGLAACSFALPASSTTSGLQELGFSLVFFLGVVCALVLEVVLLICFASRFHVLLREENEWFAKPLLSLVATGLWFLSMLAGMMWEDSPLWWQRACAVASVPIVIGWVFHLVLDIIAPFVDSFSRKKDKAPNTGPQADG